VPIGLIAWLIVIELALLLPIRSVPAVIRASSASVRPSVPAASVPPRLMPGADQEDLREFAWHYLWRQAGRIAIPQGNQHRATAVVFAGDGLLSASNDGRLHHWDLDTRRLRSSTSISGGNMVFSADGSRVVSHASPQQHGRISYHDARTGALLAELELEATIQLTALSDDSKRVAIVADLDLDPKGAAMLTGDVNGDGRSDLVYVVRPGQLGVVVSAQLSSPDGTWASVTSFVRELVETPTNPPLLGDVNGDARADLVFTKFDSVAGILAVHTATAGSDGAFGATIQTSLPFTSTITDRPPLLGDIDGDGRADLIFARYDQTLSKTIVETAAGLRDGEFAPWVRAVLDDHLFDLLALVGDINGDGRSDLITISRTKGQGPFVRTAISRGDGSFHTPGETLLPNGDKLPNKTLFLAGDANGDRKTDLISVWYETKSQRMATRTAAALGDGAFVAAAGTSYRISEKALAHPLRAADINGDGMDDLILDRRQPDPGFVISAFAGKEDGGFTGIRSADFGHNRAIVLLWEPTTGQSRIIWETKTFQETGNSYRHGVPTDVEFSPNGQRLAVSYDAGSQGVPGQNWTCCVLHLHRGRNQCDPLHVGDSRIQCVAFSADGNALATGGGAQHGVRVWDLTTGQSSNVTPHGFVLW
jgi:hypothetical protein